MKRGKIGGVAIGSTRLVTELGTPPARCTSRHPQLGVDRCAVSWADSLSRSPAGSTDRQRESIAAPIADSRTAEPWPSATPRGRRVDGRSPTSAATGHAPSRRRGESDWRRSPMDSRRAGQGRLDSRRRSSLFNPRTQPATPVFIQYIISGAVNSISDFSA
jgi:hypothetical protein